MINAEGRSAQLRLSISHSQAFACIGTLGILTPIKALVCVDEFKFHRVEGGAQYE